MALKHLVAGGVVLGAALAALLLPTEPPAPAAPRGARAVAQASPRVAAQPSLQVAAPLSVLEAVEEAPAPAAPSPDVVVLDGDVEPEGAEERAVEVDRPAPGSWVLPLELGWDGATPGPLLRKTVPFRPTPARRGDVVFSARVLGADGVEQELEVPVPGLLPEDLAQGQEVVELGDQVFLARAPVLLRLPDLPLPARVDLLRPDGRLVTTLTLVAEDELPR